MVTGSIKGSLLIKCGTFAAIAQHRECSDVNDLVQTEAECQKITKKAWILLYLAEEAARGKTY